LIVQEVEEVREVNRGQVDWIREVQMPGAGFWLIVFVNH